MTPPVSNSVLRGLVILTERNPHTSPSPLHSSSNTVCSYPPLPDTDRSTRYSVCCALYEPRVWLKVIRRSGGVLVELGGFGAGPGVGFRGSRSVGHGEIQLEEKKVGRRVMMKRVNIAVCGFEHTAGGKSWREMPRCIIDKVDDATRHASDLARR